MTQIAGVAQQILNTVYVNPPAYVRSDHDTLRVERDKEKILQIPMHHIGALVCFGDVLVSPTTIHRCAADGKAVVFLSRNGQFRARMSGPTRGNVLLRQAQQDALRNSAATVSIARNIVAGKLKNSRTALVRAARETELPVSPARLRHAASEMGDILARLRGIAELEEVRGSEGSGATIYFSVFSEMIRKQGEDFTFTTRNRRPPRDPVNALLSFLYSLLLSDCVTAAESVGLDPQFGYLHALRPGRPALALDLMEELRPVIADRVALTLINRRQVSAEDFSTRPGGGVEMSDAARRTVLNTYQLRKQDEVQHPVLSRKVPLGIVPQVQARLLARHLRGDAEAYIPFMSR